MANFSAFQLRSHPPTHIFYCLQKVWQGECSVPVYTGGSHLWKPGGGEEFPTFQQGNWVETSNVELRNSDFWVQMECNIRAHPSTQGALVDVDLLIASDNGPVSTGTFPLHNIGSTRHGTVRSCWFSITPGYLFHIGGSLYKWNEWLSIQPPAPLSETSSVFTYESLTPSLPLRRGLEHSSLRTFIDSNSIAMVIIIATRCW